MTSLQSLGNNLSSAIIKLTFFSVVMTETIQQKIEEAEQKDHIPSTEESYQIYK